MVEGNALSAEGDYTMRVNVFSENAASRLQSWLMGLSKMSCNEDDVIWPYLTTVHLFAWNSSTSWSSAGKTKVRLWSCKKKWLFSMSNPPGVECCSLFDCSPALEGCDNESGRCELWQAGFAGCETMRSNFWEPRCKQSLFSLLCLQICECVDVFLGKSFWDSCFNWHWKERLIERLSNSNLQRLTNSDCFSKGRQEIHPDKDCKARGATQFAFRVFLA